MLKLTLFLVLDVSALFVAGGVTRGQSGPLMPTFFARRDYPIGNDEFVQIGDTNGDGIPDLMLLNVAGRIDVEFGNGDGTFRPGPVSTAFAGFAISFAATDLNGDGKIDVALPNSGAVVVAMGNGDGTFQGNVNYPINDGNITFLATGDFNGDGILDIATAGNSGVWLLTGKGDGSFNAAVLAAPVPGAWNIAATDFNGDQKLDLAIGLPGSGFAVLLGNGNGTFQTPQMFSAPKKPAAIAVGSLTKGGPPGIAVSSSSANEVYLYFGNGKGGFSGPKPVSLPGAGYVAALVIGDVNGDGRPDLVSSSGYVAYGEGGANFSSPMSFAVDSTYYPTNLALADLRNNGLTDIVTNARYVVSVLLNQNNKGFEDGVWTSVPGGAGCGVKGDFNGDGHPDLAVNNTNGSTSQGIVILLGTGKGAAPFTLGSTITLGGADCLVTTDLNDDGKLDLLVPTQGSVYAYLGNGDGTFTLSSTTPTPSEGYLATGDFNHDGKVDFATSGNLIALGNGDGTFQNPTDIVANPPSGGFSGIAAGDINNDGWKDLVLTSNVFPVEANVTVLLNNHKGGFTQVPTKFGALTVQPILNDLNGDGNLDLILGASQGSGAFLYLGNGKGTFTSLTSLGGILLTGGDGNFVADVNGDGIPDVLVLSADTTTVYLGEGNGTYATPFAIGTGPAPGSILVGHFHEQSTPGLPDIVVPDISGGVMVLTNSTK